MKNLLKNTLNEIKNGAHLTRESGGKYTHCIITMSPSEAKTLDKQLKEQDIKGLSVRQSYISGIGLEVMAEFIMDNDIYVCPALNKEEVEYEERKKAKELEEMRMFGL